MAITEKTRKILWGRSGNRCALCRCELVIDETDLDNQSVVGDECHLVSAKVNGPRHDPILPADRLDEPANLILLCRVHHKMIDDQCETYTLDILHRLKANHETWVLSSLAEHKVTPPVRIRRIRQNIPSHLLRLTTGRDVTAILSDARAYSFWHDEPASGVEVELIAGFLQEAQDWGELWDGLEASDRVKTAFRMTSLLRELEETGFWVFGGREVQRVEGGIGPPSTFPVAIIHVLRPTNPEVITLDPQHPLPRPESATTSPDTTAAPTSGDT